MKTITKILLTPFLLGIFALTSCGGNGLVNEKEVTSTEFATKAALTPTNTYTTCDEKGYVIVNEGEEMKSEYSTRLSWNKNSKAWEAPFGAAYYPVEHIVLGYVDFMASLALFEATDQAHHYLADNGFRVSATFTKEVTKDGVTASAKCDLTYVWNEFGYPTSIKGTINQQIGTAKSSQQLDISFTYSSSN